jgi:drug/metabolite transporter (DMT)-like permease
MNAGTSQHASGTAVALMIAAIVTFATVGDLLIASAMRKLDLDAIRAKSGIAGAAWAVITNVRFCGGILGMACGFFALLYALSHADVSLIGPASASLTFVTNAAAARFFLKENVDRRRWAAAVCICLGVALLGR